MSMSSADKLLSNLTGSEKTSLSKTLDLSKFGSPRSFFYIPKRALGCEDELREQNISLDDCVSSRDYCD